MNIWKGIQDVCSWHKVLIEKTLFRYSFPFFLLLHCTVAWGWKQTLSAAKKLFVAPHWEVEHESKNLADKHFVVWNHGPEIACHSRHCRSSCSEFGKSSCSFYHPSKTQLNHSLWTPHTCLLIQHTYRAVVHWMFFSIMTALFKSNKNVEAFAGRQILSFPSVTVLWGWGCWSIPRKGHRLYQIRIWQLLLCKKIAVWFFVL